MKRTLSLIMTALILIGFASCSKPVSDKQIAQAYNLYINAPQTLSKTLSTTQTGNIISETVANADETYVRKTEINQADKTSKITVTFTEFHPDKSKSVTMDGEIILSSLSNLFAINGTLSYKGMKPSRLEFRNATLGQTVKNGTPTFHPVDGTIHADKREIPVDVFFMEIMK